MQLRRVCCRVAIATALSLVPNAVINEAESLAYTPHASFTATFWGVPKQWDPPVGWSGLEIADSCVNEVLSLVGSILVYRRANKHIKVRWPQTAVSWRELLLSGRQNHLE